jgi:hypothetical protein
VRSVRPCRDEERPAILEIVNAAAEAYRGVIPGDCWRELYMPLHELDGEIATGVEFWGHEAGGAVVGVMGFQSVLDVDLIRHAYVSLPTSDKAPAAHSSTTSPARPSGACSPEPGPRPTGRCVSTAVTAFELVGPAHTPALLKRYWAIPDRQIDASVVLANPPLADA